ncbi:fungal specific transcription factor domain-containing protein [Drepanopeziza brunnea f. sp. 'multigermtubi' MB_m1]|uniref:Fungal specific transcription factor domain-containing protein n=2 Tax=Drepanopeziza brunnea f. sp. 'multigermtubi' TaxID=698441 RepID=K1XHV5_MARBU|nr:fungal specific transcription factor domain-containing protein [Drepanopeziza brunnea f. sp. 'multigermtubi' MB_m1]EKD12039.1 fungal specific transcription factor domain-containing protein [Drepanopeziza brunnea f. sp. 'multigermtubi' MB_m1]
MSNPTNISRTEPIIIASRKPRQLEPSIETPNSHHLNGGAHLSSSMSSTASGDSETNTRSPTDRPCDACRKRDNPCAVNEGQTSCVLCQYHNQDCTLVQSPQPRKRKLNTEGKEESVAKRRTDERRRYPTESSISSTGATNSLIEEMANIGGPIQLKRTLGLQNDRHSQYIGPTTDFEPSLIDLSPFDPQDESLLSRGTLRKVSDVDTFLMLPDYTTPGYEHVIEDADAIEALVAPHGPALLELYFRIIHPYFPILQKVVFYQTYNRSYREFSPAILAAVYILAINWWDHSEELANQPRPDIEELERLARVTLADAMYRPKLSTVQAGLLLSQRPEGDQWAPTAQLVAIGQELGLHLDCSNWKIPPWERGLRKRLAWALYMQDKWGSLVHGRPSHIFATNWAVKRLSPNDFPDFEVDESDVEESTEYERGRLLFTQMITLSQILAEVLDTFFTLQAMAAVTQADTHGTNLVLQLAKPVQLKLKEWFAALPQCLRMESSAAPANSKQLISTGSLHLAYFATEITLHRRIIRSLAPGTAPSSPTSRNSKPALDPYIVHICRSAAKTRLISAMDFVNRLTSSHLRSFWYFASKANFALIGTFGSLLWATAPGREEAEWYRRRLGEYRWTLGVSSKGGGAEGGGNARLTEFAMGMLDTSTGLLNSLPEKPALSRVCSEADNLGAQHRQRSIVEGYGYGSFSNAGGFGIGAARNGSAGLYGLDREGDADTGLAMRSGLESGISSPGTSVSSSEESSSAHEAFNAPQAQEGHRTNERC